MALEQKLYTPDDLWELSGQGRYELVEGMLIEMSPTGWLHGEVAGEIFGLLREFVKKHKLGRVTAAETGFTLAPNTVRAPDVGFIAAARVPEKLPVKFVPFAPELAVEVVSPSDKAADIHDKVLDYLHAGTRLVWVLYPSSKSVAVHTPNGSSLLDGNETLDGSDVLPGFSINVAQIFTTDAD